MIRRLRDWALWAIARFQAKCLEPLDRLVDRTFGNDDIHHDRTLVQAFRPDAEAIEEAPVPISAHAALRIVLAILGIAILWAIFGSVDRIVVAQGKITTRDPMLVLQPFTTSRIVSINVLPGDHVKKGQVLARFDPLFAQADVTSLQQKTASLSAQAERLEAELDGRLFAAKSGDSPERIAQAQIYAQEMSNYDAATGQRQSQLVQIQSQIDGDKDLLPGIQAQLDVANNVMSMQQRLEQEQAASTLDVLRAQSSRIDSQNRLRSTQADLQKLEGQKSETLHERVAFIDKWRSDHSQQLVDTRKDLSEATETLNKAHGMRDLTELRAPADAVVLEIADRSVGSVMREAETLVTLVPDGAKLYVEANVSSRDVGYLRTGNDVRVKLEAYPFQQHGTIRGRLDVISPDAVPLKQDDPKQQQMVYRAQVTLIESPATLAARGFRIRPGMVASAEIRTGKRSIASYILEPVLRTTDESLREP